MYQGHDADEMARMRAKRASPSEPREGRIIQGIVRCYETMHPGPIRTRDLLQWTYRIWGTGDRKWKTWHRRYVIQVARRLGKPERFQGPRSGRGRPGYVWIFDPKLMERWVWAPSWGKGPRYYLPKMPNKNKP